MRLFTVRNFISAKMIYSIFGIYTAYISLHLFCRYQLLMSLTLTTPPPPKKKKLMTTDTCAICSTSQITPAKIHIEPGKWWIGRWFSFSIGWILGCIWTGWWQLKIIFMFALKNWGRWSNLTRSIFFSNGWFNHQLVTLPKFNSSPLKSYRNPSRKGCSLPIPSFFRGELWNFQQGYRVIPNHFPYERLELTL